MSSLGFLNGAYFSRGPPRTQPLPHNQDSKADSGYNSSKTYIAFLIGDGDNMDFLQVWSYSVALVNRVRVAV